MSDLEELMTLVKAELKGRATPDQQDELAGDVDTWLDGLRALLNDLDMQLERNAVDVERRCRQHPAWADEVRERHVDWVARTTIFRGVVERRLRELEHGVEVRRRRRLEEAHHALTVAVADVLDVCPDDLPGVALDGDHVHVPADALAGLADAYAALDDVLAGSPALAAAS